MQSKHLLRKTAGFLFFATAFAAAPVKGDVYTFDNPTSTSIARLDYHTPLATGTIAWTAVDAGSNGSSGSLGFTANLQATAERFNPGYSTVALSLDLFDSPGRNFSKLSFDMMVDPASAPDTYGSYGLFIPLTRNEPNTYNGLLGEGLGNPTGTNNLAGTWQHFDIPLDPAVRGANLRGLAFQFFASTGSYNVNGNVRVFMDNIVLTVPEPSPLALALLSGGLWTLVRRRH